MGLTLLRKEGHSIRVDGPCTITVSRIRGRNVSLLCEAEPEVGIWRGELVEKRLGIRDWGLEPGSAPSSNPQSPIPNPGLERAVA
jgi:sRNA-binding carbon storage regulator CsrA